MTPIRQQKPAEVSRRKRWIFRVILICLPFLFLLALESFLRLVNYGPNIALFRKEKIRGKEYYIMNPAVKGRYFSNVAFAPTASPDFFLVHKHQGSFRIFCLGGSTTVGYPYWFNGSFSSFLRDRLQKIFPDRSIEIVNIGMTATNSFTVLDMARDVIDYSPDLIIVYDGHNEFYGALGVSSTETLGGSRFLSNLYLRLLKFKTFLLLREGLNKAASIVRPTNEPLSRGTLMETMARGKYVAYGSNTYWAAYESFNGNIRDLRDLCTEHHIPLILSTQVSNLKGQAPFISEFAEHTSPQAQQEITTLLRTAEDDLKSGAAIEGLRAASTALGFDSSYARTHFALGQCYESTHQPQKALEQFTLARDYDALRFRTSSDFNSLILSFQKPPEVYVADIERVFKSNTPDSLIDNELITEHLHPNSRGFFLMAKEYARQMRAAGLLASPTDWRTRDTISDDALWSYRPVTTLDELVAQRRTEVLTSGWPFKDQYPIVDAVPAADTLRQLAERATRGILDWKAAHAAAAQFYESRHELHNAELEYRAIVDQIPLDLDGYLSLARCLYLQNRFSDMTPVLLASLTVEPTIQAYRTLGDIKMNEGNPTASITFYERMDSFAQTQMERIENGYVLAKAYAAANRQQEAKERILQVLKLAPDFQPGVDLLLKLK